MTPPPALEPKLRGKVAVVTGAARGLGRAYALRLARLGADVVIADLNLDGAAEFAEELFAPTVMDECRHWGGRSLGVAADLSSKDAVEALMAQAVDELGSVDIVVNNAGGLLRPVEASRASAMSEDDLRFILDVNLMSAVFCCQAAVPYMRRAGWGRIVNISSQSAVRGMPYAVHYNVAKAGIIHYTRCLAAEVGPDGINVNCLAPGLIKSSRAVAQFPDREERAKDIPLRRLGEPEECAKAVEFFCTDLSDYVTGQCLAVCGGMVLSPT